MNDLNVDEASVEVALRSRTRCRRAEYIESSPADENPLVYFRTLPLSFFTFSCCSPSAIDREVPLQSNRCGIHGRPRVQGSHLGEFIE